MFKATLGNYRISETGTKRDVDFRRFEVEKAGAKKPYVVSWQTATGRKASCSCPGGIFHGHCKHTAMVASLVSVPALKKAA